MLDQWLANEGIIRVAVTLSLLVFFSILEALFPCKVRVATRRQRWLGNGVLQLLNSLVVRLFAPWLIPMAVALGAAATGEGLLRWFVVPFVPALLLSILLLDLTIYWQHRLMHRFTWLWRLHRVHHADVDVDATTALRFHPLEIVFSMVIKSSLVWFFGVPASGVLIFAILLNGMAIFNHANLRLPTKADWVLRCLLVTPDMHRIHHSVIGQEHDSNFGFNLSCWDRLFGSYCDQAYGGQQKMILGLNETNGQKTGSVVWMLKQPFA